jgi:hypothetical protein
MYAVAIGNTKTEFLATRSSSRWDEILKTTDDSVNADTLLRRQLQALIDPVIEQSQSTRAIELTLSLLPSQTTTPFVSINHIAGLAPERCKIKTPVLLSRQLDAADQLNWSTTLSWNSFELLDCAIDTYAAKAVSSASTTANALADLFDCDAFAKTLDDNVTWTAAESRSCTADCLSDLCRSALEVMYERARAALSNTRPVTLTLSATGRLSLDNQARPVTTQGTWVGRYTSDSSEQTISSTFESP